MPFSPQDGLHYTLTRDEYERLLQALREYGYSDAEVEETVVLYNAKESYTGGAESFLSVYNEGTTEFDKLGLKALLDQVEWGADLPGVPIHERGNESVPFGEASGQCLGREYAGGGDSDLGMSFPSPLKHTLWAMNHFRVMSLVAQKLGIEYAQEEFLRCRPEYAPRFERFCNNIEIFDIHDNCYESLMVARLPNEANHRLKMHGDDQNCLELPDVVVCSRFLEDKNKRESIIAYQRKSCCEAMERLQRLEPTLTKCHDKVSSMPTPLLMGDHEAYFEYTGCAGSVAVVDKKSKDVVAHVKKTPTSISRWQTYMAMVAYAFAMCNAKCRFTKRQVSEVVYCLVNYVSLLGFSITMMEWSEHGLPENNRENTIVHLINNRIIELFGTAAGGPCPRSCNHAGHDLEMEEMRHGVNMIFGLITAYEDRWSTRDRSGKSLEDYGTEAVEEEFNFITKRLQTIKHCGEFTCQIIATFLLMTGICHQPSLLEFASVTSANAAMKDNDFPVTEADASFLMAAIAFRENLSFSSAENLLCEATRIKDVYDLMLPGQAIFFLCTLPGCNRRILKWARKTENGIVVESAPIFEARDEGKTAVLNILWESGPEPKATLVLSPHKNDPKKKRDNCRYKIQTIKCLDIEKCKQKEKDAATVIESIYSTTSLSWSEKMAKIKGAVSICASARKKREYVPTKLTAKPLASKKRKVRFAEPLTSNLISQSVPEKREPAPTSTTEMQVKYQKEKELNKVIIGIQPFEVYRMALTCLQKQGCAITKLTKDAGIEHFPVPERTGGRDFWYYAKINANPTDYSKEHLLDRYLSLAVYLEGQTRYDGSVRRVVFLRKSVATAFVLFCIILDAARTNREVAEYVATKAFGKNQFRNMVATDKQTRTVVAVRLRFQVSRFPDQPIYLASENCRVFLLLASKKKGTRARTRKGKASNSEISSQWVFDLDACGVNMMNNDCAHSDILHENLPDSDMPIFDCEDTTMAKLETESSDGEDDSAKRSLPI